MLSLVYRHFLVWSRHLWVSLGLHLVAPIITLYGLGTILGDRAPMSYLVPGFLINSVLISTFISTTYGLLERFFSRRYEAWLATNISLAQALGADCLFLVGRGLILGTGIWTAGLIMGLTFQPLAYLWAMLVLTVATFVTCCIGLTLVAISSTYDDLSVSEPFLNAIFIFSGVFAASSLFPYPLQVFAQIFPVYHAIQLIRPAFTGDDFTWTSIFTHIAVLAGQGLLFSSLAYRAFQRRLFA